LFTLPRHSRAISAPGNKFAMRNSHIGLQADEKAAGQASGLRGGLFKIGLLIVLINLSLLWAGCGGADHSQSALHPAGSAAERIAWLWWFMFIVLAAVFVIVMALLFVAVFRPRTAEREPPPLGNKFIIVSAIVLPSFVLVVLLIFSIRASLDLRAPAEGFPIRVIGHQWWWEVQYYEHGFTTANEIHIPVGQPVIFELTSMDVIHSFWVPNLGGKMDLVPGHTNRLSLHAVRPGVFRGQCAEFCGLQHALMAFVVVAVPKEEFDSWLEQQQKPAPVPATLERQRGQQVFFEAACNNCHAIAGTAADGRIGPDLTHIGSRRSIGAGILPNNRGNLSGWIANPQPLKPGNRMPASFLPPDDLHALVSYLESLK
jgi:cytochrome c oxidase subunit II